jgi:hypothetical protein
LLAAKDDFAVASLQIEGILAFVVLLEFIPTCHGTSKE